MNNNELLAKITQEKAQLDSFRPLPPELLKNLLEWFNVELAHHSTAIEGNTLTRRETALVLKAGLTVNGKTLREHLIDAIGEAQLFGKLENYYNVVYRSIDRSLQAYLQAVNPTTKFNRELSAGVKQLLKIGELAKEVGVTVYTIRHWTKEGLLEVAETTRGGYQLYNRSQVEKVNEIRRLQSEDRLSLSEIKTRFLKQKLPQA